MLLLLFDMEGKEGPTRKGVEQMVHAFDLDRTGAASARPAHPVGYVMLCYVTLCYATLRYVM